MDKLTLKYTDENGVEHRLSVDRTPFTIGRHSACDLTIPDSRLSREHASLAFESGHFMLADLGSSNGTTLNGTPIDRPSKLNDGDRFDLGGGIVIEALIVSAAETGPVSTVGNDVPASDPAGTAVLAPPPTFVSPPSAAHGADDRGIPTIFFFLAPLMAILVLAVVIGGIAIFGGGGKDVADSRNEDIPEYYDEYASDEPGTDTKPSEPKNTAGIVPSGPANLTPTGPSPGLPPSSPTPIENTEKAKVERNSTNFVREMAKNDPRAFLTGEQAGVVQAKIAQMVRSPALADNINSARRNASALRTLASQKNLRPHFLAAAAITKLGSSRGDIQQAAQNVADVYEKLVIQIGNENFDDALLMVAAYDQGAAGDTMKMRNMLQSIAETPGSPGTREIRSIWYLHRAGRISQAEYDRAITFLAIGTIAQNPKDFGVNAEGLRF
ncbi:MAG TPA: FHA domain-containing protein [Pyrinomonadaceae bacterium]|nr:FHA domain-containing protein [Pyrinomonadaceae bacterium]